MLCEVYKEINRLGNKIPKRDRFGIWAQIAQCNLTCIELSISASLGSKDQKMAPLKQLRIAIDIEKRLIRICQELNIIEEKKYFHLQEQLIEASKMAHGWLTYIERNSRPK